MAVKNHKKLGENQMRCRSFCGQIKAIAAPKVRCTKLDKLYDRLDKLDRANPSKISGRHAFVQHLVASAGSRIDCPKEFRKVRQTIFKKHGAEWTELSAQKHKGYGRAAERLKDKKQEELASDRRDTMDEINAAEQLQQASLKCEPLNIR